MKPRPFSYRPLDRFVVRVPRLPVERYHSDATATDAAELLHRAASDTDMRAALAVSSESLDAALARPGAPGKKARQRVDSLLRYLIRASTRPTPFGLFAGVGLGRWDESTDLALAGRPHPIRVRADMGWLMGLVQALDARREVRTRLRWIANPMIIERAGRIFLEERADPTGRNLEALSMRATGVVQRALAATRTPIAYSELVAHLVENTPRATRAKVEELIDRLWHEGLLYTDLRPPLLAPDPLGHVIERLSAVTEASAERHALAELAQIMARLEQCAPAAWASAYREAVPRARAIGGASQAAGEQAPFQVDMGLALAGERLHRRLADEIAEAAELLLRLSPIPDGSSSLAAYREQFHARYGHDREVPLLEVLDPTFGLGPPGTGHAPPGRQSERPGAQARNTLVLQLALRAIRDGLQVVELDDELVARLETGPIDPERLPPSLEVFASLAAASPAAIDAGEHLVVMGMGVAGAGRSLGRFAYVVGTDVDALLDQAARAEAAAHDPGLLWCELVYLPRQPRVGNVAIRPRVRPFELDVLVTPAASPGATLHLDDLWLGVRDRRFYVRSASRDAEVVFTATHMLTYRQAPQVVRFLSELSQDGIRQLTDFPWGPAAGYPFLPRVQRGRVVLSPARWYVDATTATDQLAGGDPARFEDAFARWRDRWHVPRHVYLTAGDNRLLLDLACTLHREQVRAAVASPVGGSVLFYEALPGLDHAWLPGPDGHHLCELVVPLVLERPAPARPRSGPLRHAERAGQAPAGQWLFAKLYVGPRIEDDFIVGPMAEFVQSVQGEALLDDWFFIRYRDPDPHLRLRLSGKGEVLTSVVLPRLYAWASDETRRGRARKFSIDTYEPEVQRYGGEAGVSLAEALFGADSRAVVRLLGLLRGLAPGAAGGVDRTLIAVLTCDDLLAGLGLSARARLEWYGENTRATPASADAYRAHGKLLQALLESGDARHLWIDGGDVGIAQGITDTLAQRRAEIARIAGSLRERSAGGVLSRPPAEIYGSYLHMHCNRLLGIAAEAERKVMELLVRTRTSLDRRGRIRPAS